MTAKTQVSKKVSTLAKSLDAQSKNGSIQADITQLSVDITTLPKYSSIPLGTHKLTIVASAPGYLDSDPSQEVTFINGYPITFKVTNCTYSPSAEMVAVFEPTTFTFETSTGYSLPSSISVTGVDSDKYIWTVASDGLTANLVIIEPTGDVTITAVGVEITETIKGVWSLNTTIPGGVWTEQAVNFTSNGTTFTGMRWDGHNLYYVDSTGESETQVYSLNEDTQVGTWENGGERSYWRIVDFGTTGETASKIFADYVRANAVQSGKLATPAGVQVADTSASWDEVENATEYEIVVDNASWGVCKPTAYDYTQDGDTVTIQNAPYTQDGDTVTIT